MSVSEDTSTDMDVCEKLENKLDVSVDADFNSLQTNPGNDAVPSEPINH